jgi:hypothetical protein
MLVLEAGPNLPTPDGRLAFEICAHVLSNAQRVQSGIQECSLKEASLTLLSLTVIPFCATTEDRIIIRVGLVGGRVDTSGFLVTDDIGELPSVAGPSANDSQAQSGLTGSNSSLSYRLMAFVVSGLLLVYAASSCGLCTGLVDCVLAGPLQICLGTSLRS